MHRVTFVRFAALASSLAIAPLAAQQPNSTSASLTFAGVGGPPYPITLPINVNALSPGVPLTMLVRGQPNHIWFGALTLGNPLLPGISTPYGQVNVDLGMSLATIGGVIGSNGTATYPVWPTTAGRE